MSRNAGEKPAADGAKPVGRRGWFKQAGAAAAGLALGSGARASGGPDVHNGGMTATSGAPASPRPVRPRRGIDCGFDEGPI